MLGHLCDALTVPLAHGSAFRDGINLHKIHGTVVTLDTKSMQESKYDQPFFQGQGN